MCGGGGFSSSSDVCQLDVPDESPSRERPAEESVPQRLGALDEVSLEVDEKTELEREKQVRWLVLIGGV